jgi:hypothetical protein
MVCDFVNSLSPAKLSAAVVDAVKTELSFYYRNVTIGKTRQAVKTKIPRLFFSAEERKDLVIPDNSYYRIL